MTCRRRSDLWTRLVEIERAAVDELAQRFKGIRFQNAMRERYREVKIGVDAFFMNVNPKMT
jgi:hypothetical protein